MCDYQSMYEQLQSKYELLEQQQQSQNLSFSQIFHTLENDIEEKEKEIAEYKEMMSSGLSHLKKQNEDLKKKYEKLKERFNLKQNNIVELTEENKRLLLDNKDKQQKIDDLNLLNFNSDNSSFLPLETCFEWLNDYVNNSCTYNSMQQHKFIFKDVDGKKTSKIPKNGKAVLSVVLKDILNRFMKKIQTEKVEKECPVCYDTINNSVTLSCNHSFCYECINTCLKTDKRCPICRKAYFKKLIPDSFLSYNKNHLKVFI